MMKKNLLFLPLLLSLQTPSFADDIMVERMQSVVDEVSELRLRYEASVRKNETCLKELQEKDARIDSFSKSGFDNQTYREQSIRIQELEFENEKLQEKVDSHTKNAVKTIIPEDDVRALEKENRRLEEALVTAKRSLAEVQKERDTLQVKLKSSQVNIEAYELEIEENSKMLKKYADSEKKHLALKRHKDLSSTSVTTCPDDNPFPKLMMKSDKKPETPSKREVTGMVVSATGSAYRMKCDGKIYDQPENGKQIDVWEEKTSFTSNVSQGEWIKATGVFVEKRWQKARKAFWIRKEDALKR